MCIPLKGKWVKGDTKIELIFSDGSGPFARVMGFSDQRLSLEIQRCTEQLLLDKSVEPIGSM